MIWKMGGLQVAAGRTLTGNDVICERYAPDRGRLYRETCRNRRGAAKLWRRRAVVSDAPLYVTGAKINLKAQLFVRTTLDSEPGPAATERAFGGRARRNFFALVSRAACRRRRRCVILQRAESAPSAQ